MKRSRHGNNERFGFGRDRHLVANNDSVLQRLAGSPHDLIQYSCLDSIKRSVDENEEHSRFVVLADVYRRER